MANPKLPDTSAMYEGIVMHHRFTPRRHRFIYRVFSLCLDLDQLDQLGKSLRLFSVNRFNLFSFSEQDHGGGSGTLAPQIREILQERGYGSACARISLLCYPRILGYSFNPLSIYFCYNAQGTLEAILHEVSNTFGQRHIYLLPASTDKHGCVRHQCDKQMYVSPFMPMDTYYGFRIRPPEEQVGITIRQSDNTTRKAILHATFHGTRKPLTDRSLISAFVRYPLMTLKVITAIHWEALRLWRKKLKIQPRAAGSKYCISWQDKEGVFHYESH